MRFISPSFVRPHNTCVYFYVTHCLRAEIRACVNERPRALCNALIAPKYSIYKSEVHLRSTIITGREVGVLTDGWGLLYPSHSRLHFRLLLSRSFLIISECSAYRWKVTLACGVKVKDKMGRMLERDPGTRWRHFFRSLSVFPIVIDLKG